VLQHRVLLNQRARKKALTSLPPGRVRALSAFASGYIWEITATIAQSVYDINSRPRRNHQGRHNLLKSHCSDGRLARLQRLSKTYQILREHANSAKAWAVKVRDEKERDA